MELEVFFGEKRAHRISSVAAKAGEVQRRRRATSLEDREHTGVRIISHSGIHSYWSMERFPPIALQTHTHTGAGSEFLTARSGALLQRSRVLPATPGNGNQQGDERARGSFVCARWARDRCSHSDLIRGDKAEPRRNSTDSPSRIAALTMGRPIN